MFTFNYLKLYGGVFNSRQLHHFKTAYTLLIQRCRHLPPPTNYPKQDTNSHDNHTNLYCVFLHVLHFNHLAISFTQ